MREWGYCEGWECKCHKVYMSNICQFALFFIIFTLINALTILMWLFFTKIFAQTNFNLINNVTQSLTYSLTYPLTHSLTPSLTYSAIDPPTYATIFSLTCSSTYDLFDTLFLRIFYLYLKDILFFGDFRSSHPEVFWGKGVLKICSTFIGEHPCRNAISIKLLATLLKSRFSMGALL